MLLISSILFFSIILIIIVVFAITLKLGIKVKYRDDKNKSLIYESGIDNSIKLKITHNLKYYIVVIFFILFDIEVVFMYPWATNIKELGIASLYEMFIFMSILVIGLLFIYSKRIFKWH